MEDSAPLYEGISEAISLGLARPLRRMAIAWLINHDRNWTLDLGSGPGVSSRLLLSQGFKNVVATDPSRKLVDFARAKLGGSVHMVVGVSESLPFRSGSFQNVLVCFALRDVRELSQSLHEVSRITTERGRMSVVDVGKPTGLFRRSMVWFHVRSLMPMISRFLIRRRILGNPFLMIIPTFESLPTNSKILKLVREWFGPSTLREYMFGGLIVIRSKKRDPD